VLAWIIPNIIDTGISSSNDSRYISILPPLLIYTTLYCKLAFNYVLVKDVCCAAKFAKLLIDSPMGLCPAGDNWIDKIKGII